jgi:hypothetical protein
MYVQMRGNYQRTDKVFNEYVDKERFIIFHVNISSAVAVLLKDIRYREVA